MFTTLRAEWLQARHNLQQGFSAALKKPQRPQDDFLRAVIQHAWGNSTYLINYLRSNPISALDRKHLAQALGGYASAQSASWPTCQSRRKIRRNAGSLVLQGLAIRE
jgi:hypothetical protein